MFKVQHSVHAHVRLVIALLLVAAAPMLSALPANAEEPSANGQAPTPNVAASPSVASLERGSGSTEPPPPIEMPTPGESPMPREAPAPAPAYSLPWQLRPLMVGNTVRSDTNFATYEDSAARGGFTVASTLLASFKIPGTGGTGEGIAPLVRFAAVNDAPPTGTGGFAVVNPLVGVMYARRIGPLRAAAFFGMTVPIGMGGGNSPDKGSLDARNKGVPAREGMDNSLFAVDDLAVIPGVGIGYVGGGFTVQAEATLFQLQRVRGEQAQPDVSKTNFTTGLHVGWFATRMLSLGVDLHYQQWINAPIAVQKDPTGNSYHNVTIAIGPRFHIPLPGKKWVRPGVAYARGVDKAMGGTSNYNIVQVDVPVAF
jgi:hypothetical protein